MPQTVDMTTGLTDSCKRVDNVKRTRRAKVIHIEHGRYIVQQILVRQAVAAGFAGDLGLVVNKLCNCDKLTCPLPSGQRLPAKPNPGSLKGRSYGKLTTMLRCGEKDLDRLGRSH
ncbi:hypothetical protein [Ralstonia sp. A12]|uniref:hypothetical protein n=1 Tax=Ralstonia sp. A12 TaxID=1217052 RepID=UPI0012EE72FB|nr:hypothetical protein [Ralstonia sp. A12]